jgi:hypothetical protein
MLLFETHRETGFSYNISPNSVADDWYWEVSCGGYIVARGLAATREQARADAKGAAVVSRVDRPWEDRTATPAFLMVS